MASSASAPAQWTLNQVVRFWLSGEPGLDRDNAETLMLGLPAEPGLVTYTCYMQKLFSMGVRTLLQAQSILTDMLCSHLDETYGVACDLRRQLLDLLGVEWRQQVWSVSEIAIWARRPVEPTEKGDDGPWREEIEELRKIMAKLGLQQYRGHFHTDDHNKLLGMATAQN